MVPMQPDVIGKPRKTVQDKCKKSNYPRKKSAQQMQNN